VIIMTDTAVFILISILVIAGIFWLVIYAGRRGEMHRQRTTIKPPDSHREGQTDWRALSLRAVPQDPVRGELATLLAAVMANGCGESWARR